MADATIYPPSKIRLIRQLLAEIDLFNLADPPMAELSEQILGRLGRLERGSFQVAVVGQFSVGKSSFINALIGDNILPTSVLETTAVPTTVRRGEGGARLLKRVDGNYLQASADEYESFKTLTMQTLDKVPAIFRSALKQFDDFILEHPRFPFPNLEILDTPGLSSLNRAMVDVTARAACQADLVIYLVAAQTGLQQADIAFFNERPAHLPVAVVVNKIECLSPGQRREKMSTLERQIATRPQVSLLAAISARDLLQQPFGPASQELIRKLEQTIGQIDSSGNLACLLQQLCQQVRQRLVGIKAAKQAELDRILNETHLTADVCQFDELVAQVFGFFSQKLARFDRPKSFEISSPIAVHTDIDGNFYQTFIQSMAPLLFLEKKRQQLETHKFPGVVERFAFETILALVFEYVTNEISEFFFRQIHLLRYLTNRPELHLIAPLSVSQIFEQAWNLEKIRARYHDRIQERFAQAQKFISHYLFQLDPVSRLEVHLDTLEKEISHDD